MTVLRVEQRRGFAVEAVHTVSAVLCDRDGKVVASIGEDPFSTFRSAAKPFQLEVSLGVLGRELEAQLGPRDLALGAASHHGEPMHLEQVQSLLARLDRSVQHLYCGAHAPTHGPSAEALWARGERPSALHNNCSGKHSAMLARAHVAGWKTAGYEKPEHPVQQGCLESVARWAGLAPAELGRAVDGCGVVEFSSPLESMALAWSRLAVSMEDDDHARRIHTALRARPMLFGGSDRFDSIMIEETDGKVIAKVGAEGVHAAAIPEQGIGVVIKVEDGAQRAQFPAILRALQYLDALPATLPQRLEDFRRKAIRNTRGECVGEVRPVA